MSYACSRWMKELSKRPETKLASTAIEIVRCKMDRLTTPSPSNEYVVRPNPNKASLPKAPC